MILAANAILTGCPTNEKFGPDSDYFIGLQKLEENKTKEAKIKFNSCVKKGSYYCAKESAIQLTKLGDLQEQNAAAEFLYESYPGSDTLLILAQQYMKSNEIRKLLEVTENLDFAEADNELIKIRLQAMLSLDLKKSFYEESYKWFTSRAMSQELYQFYRDIYSPIEKNSPSDFAIKYRILLYKRDYLSGYSQAEELLDYFEKGKLAPSAYLASDLGKAFLYGSEQIVNDAVLLQGKAEEAFIKGSEMEFYFWFYAGRLYDGANFYFKQSIRCYENAINSTSEGGKKDNALWYLLRTRLKLSLDGTLADLGKYAKEWHDPEYFDDFFDSLIPSLIVNSKWEEFKTLFTDIDGYATKETRAQIAYLYARLIEEDYISLDEEELGQKEELLSQLYRKAMDSGSSTYYKVMAAYRLGLSDRELEDLLGLKDVESQATEEANPYNPDKAADNLLNGYAYFGFPEKIYDSFFIEGVSTDTGIYIADFLAKCGEAQEKDEYLVQSLRIASRTANKADKTLYKKQLKTVYPRNFSNLVDNYSKKYDINTSVLYALIRSESFFDKEIVSSAGAVGLTQLMSPTAGEIAQKLKVKDYELTDPETNIMFGSYYLSELIRRSNGSLLRAFFSYNAGFRKVSTWINSSMLEFGRTDSLDMDLFLETIPVSETREYGRKLIAATVMYEYLYGNSDFSQTVESLLK